MKNAKNKIVIAITVLLVLSISATMLSLPIVTAHTPPWERVSHIYGYPSPDLIGVGQTGLFVMWSNWIPPTASGEYGDRYTFTVNVIKPDGTNDTMQVVSDPVGSAYVLYTYTEVGTYTWQVIFPQYVLTGYPTPGNVPPTSANVGDIMLAAQSAPSYTTVQQEPLPKYPETPIPEDYWTRPIYENNRLWYTLAGQWLGSYANVLGSTANYVATPGPASAHVLWTTSYWSGGIADAHLAGAETEGYYNGQSYESFGTVSIILEGKLYIQIQTPPRIGQWVIDLYTGEKIAFKNTTGTISYSGSFDYSGSLPNGAYNYGQILYEDTPNQHGALPYLWDSSTGTSGVWDMYDGYSGNYICSIANVSSSGTMYRDGYGGICFVNIVNVGTSANPSYRLQIWNTTEAIWWKPQYGTAGGKTLLDGSKTEPTSTSNTYWMWRPDLNYTFDGRYGFSANVTIDNPLEPNRSPIYNMTYSILRVIPDKYIIIGTDGRNDARGAVQGFLRAISLETPTLGQTLWTTKFTPPAAVDAYPNNTYIGYQVTDAVELCQVVPEENMFYFRERITGNRWGYNMTTGEQVWKNAEPENGWNYYGLGDNYYDGKLISWGYAGVLYGYDARTGELLYNWTAPSEGEGESPYWHTTMYLACIASNGIGYCYTSEHSVNSPIRRDANIWAVNLTSGELIWKMSAWALSPKVADGRLLFLNSVDNQIYCYGRGPSKTTVSAPQTISALGNGVMITGTVTDQSPSGRHNVAGSLDFSLKDTPAISDADQETWMEYLFQGNTKPANAKGVEVTLATIDPNGNYYEIGKTTSDMNGNYGMAFNPEVPGSYQIIASFAGSNAYGPSSGTTYMAVGEAAPTAAPTAQPSTSVADMYLLPGIVGIIIAIIVIGLVIILVLRRKP
jgi:hypothetical protein